MEGYFLYIADKLDRIRLGDGGGKFDIFRELKSWDLWRAVLAEMLATMLFVFVGTMAAVNSGGEPSEVFVHIGLAFGLMIAICVQMVGHVSGGHMNPAVSLAMACTFSISPPRALLYVLAQCAGGIFGSLLLKGVTPSSYHDNLGLTLVSSELSGAQGFGVELVLTFILVFSICGCTDPNRPFFGSPALGIGLTVAVCHLGGIALTGASMNPARSLGSAVVSANYEDHWVYWAGPIAGGILGALTYKYVFDPYKGCPSYKEAVEKLVSSNDVLVLPRHKVKAPKKDKNHEAKNGMNSNNMEVKFDMNNTDQEVKFDMNNTDYSTGSIAHL